jgi:hypothetical protein
MMSRADVIFLTAVAAVFAGLLTIGMYTLHSRFVDCESKGGVIVHGKCIDVRVIIKCKP